MGRAGDDIRDREWVIVRTNLEGNSYFVVNGRHFSVFKEAYAYAVELSEVPF